MLSRTTGATIGLLLTGLIISSGCTPRVPPADQQAGLAAPTTPAEDTPTSQAAAPTAAPEAAATATSGGAAESEATPGPAAADPPAASQPQPVAEQGQAPAPAPAMSPAPAVAASPSAVPTAGRAPTSTPTPEVLAELVAVPLTNDNRIALVDPSAAKVAHTVDLSRPAGSLDMAPDQRWAWILGRQPGASAISLLDVRSGKRHDDIQLHQGDSPTGLAFSTDGSRAFIALAGKAAAQPGPSTIVFASSTGHELGRVTVGHASPGTYLRRQLSSLATVPGPNGDIVYAAGEGSGTVWALDAATGALLSEIEVGGGPMRLVPDAAHQRLYVLLDTVNQLVVIDTSTLGITGRLDLPGQPADAAVGSDGSVFVAGGSEHNGQLWVVEPAATGLRSVVPIGGTPVGLAISTDGRSLYVADRDASALAIVTADTIQVTHTIQLASAPLGVVVAHPAPAAEPAAAQATPVAAPTLAPTATPVPAGAAPPDRLPAGAIAEPFVSGANMPVALAFAPDGRLFYAELQTGRIRVVQNGSLLPTPFYQLLVANQEGAGLYGLALDPDFATNHYLYALYTAVGDANGGHGPNKLVRLTDDNNKGVDLTPILQGLPSVGTPSSGAVRVGPDGKLYVSVADDDRGSGAEDLDSLAGKILRINTDGSMPDDNPFGGQAKGQPAIWAYGFHDPATFAFDPVGHKLVVADNGVHDNDELDVVIRGASYGFPPAGFHNKPDAVDPIALLSPSIRTSGSTFYSGTQLGDWTGDWFSCDREQQQLRRVHLAPLSRDRVVFDEVVKQGCGYDVATGPDGALYYSDARGIYRIRAAGADVLPAVKQPDSAAVVPSPTAASR